MSDSTRKLRKKRARKTSVAQTDLSKVTFHTITSSVSLVTSCQLCLAFQHLIQIGLITNSQSKTPTYVLATLWDSNTILCTNSQTLYTEGLERLRLSTQATLKSFPIIFAKILVIVDTTTEPVLYIVGKQYSCLLCSPLKMKIFTHTLLQEINAPRN